MFETWEFPFYDNSNFQGYSRVFLLLQHSDSSIVSVVIYYVYVYLILEGNERECSSGKVLRKIWEYFLRMRWFWKFKFSTFHSSILNNTRNCGNCHIHFYDFGVNIKIQFGFEMRFLPSNNRILIKSNERSTRWNWSILSDKRWLSRHRKIHGLVVDCRLGVFQNWKSSPLL